MVIIPMAGARKMLNIFKIYRLLILIAIFVFSSVPSVVFALNYGSGLYGVDLYSATIPSAAASPDSGAYTSNQSVTLSTSMGNTIRYSAVSTPIDCSSGTLYSSPILLTTSTTLYTRTCDAYGNSTPASFSYSINLPVSRFGSYSSYAIPVTQVNVGNPSTTITSEKNNPLAKKDIKISRTLKKGLKGDDVKEVQIYLNALGYNSGHPDGVFGSKTFLAVKNYQKSNKLNSDGMVGKKTIEKIRLSLKKL